MVKTSKNLEQIYKNICNKEVVNDDGIINVHKMVNAFKNMLIKNYIDNVKELYEKAIQSRVLNGYYPYKTPLGYKRSKDNKGNLILVIDDDNSSSIRMAFQLYSDGKSLKEVCEILQKSGFRNSKNNPVAPKSIKKILNNPIYVGKILFKGIIYNGIHKPIVSEELFEKVKSKLQK